MAVKFDGTDDYAATAAGVLNAVFAGTQEHTVMAWVYITALTADAAVFGHWGSAGQLQTYVKFESDDNSIKYAMQDTGSRVAQTGAGTISQDTWHHVAGVRSGNTIYVYVDGVVGGTTASVGTITTATEPYAAGRRIEGATLEPWPGYIADIAAFNVAFTTPQIAELAAVRRRLPLRYFNANLQFYAPLMGPTGVALNAAHWGCKDLSGNGRHLSTINSAPTWADDPLPPQSWLDGPFGGAQYAAAPSGVSIAAIADYYRRMRGA